MTYSRAGGWPASFTGVIAAASTPFRRDRSLDLGRVDAYVDFLLERGVRGLMVGGTTGEFVTLTSDERVALAKAFVSATAGRVPVIVHIGHADPDEACRLAEFAAGVGAAGLAAVTPYFHRISAATAAAHMRQLARAVPSLPFFVYNYPDAAGNPFPVTSLEAILDQPNVQGVKLSVGTWRELQPFLSLPPELLVVCGNDSLMHRFAIAGGRALVSGNAAALPDVVSRCFTSFREGRAEGRANAIVSRMVRLTRSGAADRLKQILRLRDLDVGPSRIRTFLPVEADEEQAVQELRVLLASLRRLPSPE